MLELIDREQAGKNICKYCASNEYCKEDDCMVYRGLRDTPTIQIEAEPVRHGRWIAQEDADGDISFVCSECSRRLRWDEDFCPSCGSDMRTADTKD